MTDDEGNKVFLETGAASVQIGDIVTAMASNAGQSKVDSNSRVQIVDTGGALIQDLKIHTS